MLHSSTKLFLSKMISGSTKGQRPDFTMYFKLVGSLSFISKIRWNLFIVLRFYTDFLLPTHRKFYPDYSGQTLIFWRRKISQNIQLKHACLRQITRGMLVFIRKKKSSQNFLVGNVWFEYKWIHIAFSIQNNGDPMDRTT